MDLLPQHAADNVWCSPRQDKQYIMRPKRLSRYGGEVVQLEIDWMQIYLPDKQNYYHVYQIGNLYPDFIGLFPVKNKWMSLTELSNKMGMIADLYDVNGFLAPKFETYYMVTTANNLILATRKRDALIGFDYNNEDLYFRVYSNAYFQSPRSNGHPERVVTKGGSPAVIDDILSMRNEFQVYKDKPVGYAWVIINGMFAETISTLNCKIGDVIDWIYDSSVKTIVEYEIDKLPAFDSTLDLQRKYLLHYPGSSNRIEYKDDVDFFLLERPAVGPANGLYHHQNTEKAVRMVTHKDYALSAQIVESFVNGHPTWTEPKALRILAIMRESGYDRDLVFENNRIHELYKVKDEDFIDSVIGEFVTVPNWAAPVLEASMYTKLMGMNEYTDFTIANVQEAYGYNAISKIVGETPLRVTVINGTRLVKVPETYQLSSTVFEYDANGTLIGWYPHVNAAGYSVNSDEAVLLEFFVGQGSQFLDETYNAKTQSINPALNYRMYICDKIGGVWQNNWRDVTDSGNYAIINGTLTWLINMTNFVTLVRSDKQSLVYQIPISAAEGHMEFTLTKLQYTNGQVGYGPFDVPMGDLALTINSRPLIEGIDYVVKFPKVVIFNKKYLIDPQFNIQDLVIRFSGFCNSDLTMDKVVDRGFVKWGMLSRNATYNVRDDRVLRIVNDGRLYHRDSLEYAEEDAAILIPDAQNGTPYEIRDTMVPMKKFTIGDSYALREKSRIIDKAVSDYLTMMLPEPIEPVPNVINERYPLYSPFLSQVIYDLLDGVIEIDETMPVYPEAYLREKCAAYEYLLAFDPTQPQNTIDPLYVIIHPVYHNNVTQVRVGQFNFLQKVNNLYTGGSVLMNNFLQLV